MERRAEDTIDRRPVQSEKNTNDPRYYYIRIMDLEMTGHPKFGAEKAMLKLLLGSKFSDTVFRLDDFQDKDKKQKIQKEAHIFKYDAEEFLNVHLQPNYDKGNQQNTTKEIQEQPKPKYSNQSNDKGSLLNAQTELVSKLITGEVASQIPEIGIQSNINDSKNQINSPSSFLQGTVNKTIDNKTGVNTLNKTQLKDKDQNKNENKSPYSGYCRILLPPLMQYPHICHQITANLITFQSGTKISSKVIATVTLHIYYRLDFRGFIDIIPIKTFLKHNIASVGEMRPFVQLELDSCKEKWRSLEGAGIRSYWSGHFHTKREPLKENPDRCRVTNISNNIQINDSILQAREKDFDREQDYERGKDTEPVTKTATGTATKTETATGTPARPNTSKTAKQVKISKQEVERREEYMLSQRERRHDNNILNMKAAQKSQKLQRQLKSSKISKDAKTQKQSQYLKLVQDSKTPIYFDIKRFPLISAGSFLTARVLSMPLIGKEPEQAGMVKIRISNAGFFKHPQIRSSKKSKEETQGYILDHPYANRAEGQVEEDVFEYKHLVLTHTSKQGEKKQIGDITFLVRFIFDPDNVTEEKPFEIEMPQTFAQKEKKEVVVKQKA